MYMKNKKKRHKPFAGYITKLGNLFTKLSADPKVESFLHDNEDWKEYVTTSLAIENERNESALGGKKKVSENKEVRQVEEHLAFESNLVNFFQQLKEAKFEVYEEILDDFSDSIEWYDPEYWKEDQLGYIAEVEATNLTA